MKCFQQWSAVGVLAFIASTVLLVEALPCQPVQCLLNPCDVSSCPAFSSGAECNANYCGSCSAKWTMNGVDVTEACLNSSQSASSSGVTSELSVTEQKAKLPKPSSTGDLQLTSNQVSLQQDGADPPCSSMKCVLDPCALSACPAYPSSAVCSSSYCGGCTAVWTVDGVTVTETCDKSAKAAGLRSRTSATSEADVETESSVPSKPGKVETRGRNRKRFRARQPTQRPTFWPSWTWTGRRWNPFSHFWGQ